ncbi:MAG TPA: bifunctional tRNA (5-methylaminomethyl-2-thiouridine)(34)-methyltransferase MnmD/FAD-dependent 5-carboxymethylaminomethyl-2-thiouridine(34) oxidoreductase MnmC [Albitalea sp.]|uniref:bifunctional tRNA (5-methylaminomethyl-2-thiouridine)(34)-methyltransferase MnmD/FAD-dependent 5-carboxymethylaminomethyl-2-thiouridine(34) oxidoreductase MnmC n=1 Tax=Piscinibacter sp. TaxID=1903157 RepID=UPI002ED32223
MRTQPIVAAHLETTPEGLPFSPAHGDVYHPGSGALAQARHVFLDGNGLPQRWRGRDRFVVLETGFGLGNNFLATWDAWRRDPRACRTLSFMSVERHPLRREDLAALPRDPALADIAAKLCAAWPALTCNLHRIAFAGGRVELLLALGDVAQWLPELVAEVDAFYLDGFAPARNPEMWEPRVLKALARLAAPGATLATWTAARGVRDGLTSAGFETRIAPGQGGKRDITLASFAPRFTPRRAPARHRACPAGHAVIVGAGLAGCAAAAALADHGWRCTLVDRHASPCMEASGNPAGLFHGIVNAQDGAHARFNRSAALHARRCVEDAIAHDGVAGSVDGLLRLETSGDDRAAMQAVLDRLGLPADYVQALDAAEASERAGLPLQHPAWFYPGGGWVRPAELAAAFLRRGGAAVQWRGNSLVGGLRHTDGRWDLVDGQGHPLLQADAVVLAGGLDALSLAGVPPWPLEKLRGQISLVEARRLPALPRIPLAGAGYLLPAIDGLALFGATSQGADADAAVRESDHRMNLDQLQRLLGRSLALSPGELSGRTAWRVSSDDRLPLIGALPDVHAARLSRCDQARLVPRIPGLFAFTALGSRGITWCALGAQVLASAVSGAPSPLESSLLDAVDPARFVVRDARRAPAGA